MVLAAGYPQGKVLKMLAHGMVSDSFQNMLKAYGFAGIPAQVRSVPLLRHAARLLNHLVSVNFLG
jgi:hypothetical protein